MYVYLCVFVCMCVLILSKFDHLRVCWCSVSDYMYICVRVCEYDVVYVCISMYLMRTENIIRES